MGKNSNDEISLSHEVYQVPPFQWYLYGFVLDRLLLAKAMGCSTTLSGTSLRGKFML